MSRRLSDPPVTATGAAGMVLLGAFAIQWSAALAVPAFADVGALGVSGWRFLMGAVILLVLVRPSWRDFTAHQWRAAAGLGVAVAVMNVTFFQAIARIPLGTAVAIEFMGPFVVAAVGRTSWRHVVCILIAAGGVVALCRPGGHLDPVGLVFAGLAAVCYGAYTVAAHHAGNTTPGFEGLAVGLTISSVLTLPFVVHSLPDVAHHPSLLARFFFMGLLATVFGFGAEMQALRRLPPSVVSVLLAFDPAVAFLSGFIFLSQHVTVLDLVGLLLVVAGGIGVTLDAEGTTADIPR